MVFVDVSIGEVLDKYSILEIKLKMICDTKKQEYIKDEMSKLYPFVKEYLNIDEYHKLMSTNKKIWDLNEKFMYLDEFNGKILMNANNERYLIKNSINNKTMSSLKEVKSYL